MIHGLKRYLWNICIWMTQTLNVFTGGDPDEALSSRLGKGEKRGCKFCIFMCRMLDWFDANHCSKSIEHDEGKHAVIKQ